MENCLTVLFVFFLMGLMWILARSDRARKTWREVLEDFAGESEEPEHILWEHVRSLRPSERYDGEVGEPDFEFGYSGKTILVYGIQFAHRYEFPVPFLEKLNLLRRDWHVEPTLVTQLGDDWPDIEVYARTNDDDSTLRVGGDAVAVDDEFDEWFRVTGEVTTRIQRLLKEPRVRDALRALRDEFDDVQMMSRIVRVTLPLEVRDRKEAIRRLNQLVEKVQMLEEEAARRRDEKGGWL